MDTIELQDISYRYGESLALDQVRLQIRKGEFFTLLGPSGCGKTTMLRILAGFLTPTQGKILVDGQDITAVPPERRGMGIVFQNYALFPNMTVEENIVYGLQVRRCSKGEIQKKCGYFLELTGLEELRRRKIDQLSGGQQQRVAIARALIVEPKMLLLDEPLSNLDVALRVKMRQEIREIQETTGITTLFITHDQQEALSVSDRVAVLDRGRVQQVGTPMEIYDTPANDFVAQFVGVSNRLDPRDGAAMGLPEDQRYIRPEQLRLTREGPGAPVTVRKVCFEGAVYQYTVASEHASYQVAAVNRGGRRAQEGDALFLTTLPEEERGL
ncbi:ABC transporter ATP-binding protein [Flavonifractor sp. An92]|uniref:ABC transporter ATP-binding protein n=1 Tax=Flavonifractor sp. An92 TaxID=1965666 RepID=UPI000B37513D|nr:ABC transporter ATP-binding protein [Flavonifractor sp. An92]OUN06127.1 ABC transporter ATP-binding protein [Flavonifractor sp. An92]